MGFLFALIGAIGGAYLASGSRGAFGFFAGAVFGFVLHRVIRMREEVLKLRDRVDILEQRNAALAPPDKTAQKPIVAPQRVSIYEPAPPAQPDVVADADKVAPAQTPLPASRAEIVADDDEEARARTPLPPARPSMGAHTLAVAKRWLTTGNVPVKMGVILSFFGVAFLLKYAIENEIFTIPIGVRYLVVAAFAAALLALGWRKRDENRVFALSIQGGGFGVLFLTVYAAYRLHALLSPGIAFALLVLVTIAAGVLAIRQESRALAILGTTGGFLAPVLASTGSGNHVALFSYYLVLNCAILGVAWYRPWRELNIIGFFFTFGIGTIWGYQYYVPELFSTTEPFLVLYFLFYTIIAVLYAFRQRPELRGYVDGTLLFGTPTIAFALQSQLLDHTEYGLAISAATVAAFYAALALWLRQKHERDFGLLTQALIALGVAFATIAIPLALDDRWTAIAWALEGAALVWIGVRQNTTLARITGSALSFAAGSEFISYGWKYKLGMPVLNGNYIGAVLIAAAAIYSAYRLFSDKQGRDWQKLASLGLLVWGLGWWFGAGGAEISDRASQSSELLLALLYFAGSYAAMHYAANRLDWLALWAITVALLPLTGGTALVGYGWSDDLAWPVLNANVLGGALIAWMSLYGSRKLATDKRAQDAPLVAAIVLLGWGLAFWFGTGTLEIFDRAPPSQRAHFMLLFVSLSLAAIAYAGKRFGWIAYRRVSLALLPALAIFAVVYLGEHKHFFLGLGTLAWLVALASHVWVLYCLDKQARYIERLWHGAGAVLFALLIAFETWWQLDRVLDNPVWPGTAGLLVLALAVAVLLLERKSSRWPFNSLFEGYFFAAISLLALYMLLLISVCLQNPGDPAPLAYIPLLNPFDVLSIVGMTLMWFAMQVENENPHFVLDKDSRAPQITFLAVAFLLSTLSVVRMVHHTTGVAWDSAALMNSVGVQSTLSIYWAILGLSGMVTGTRRASRMTWMIGAVLMIVVVLKLFVIDLGNTGTVARIVSFLGVGVMLLVVGYFSPVPPRSGKASAE